MAKTADKITAYTNILRNADIFCDLGEHQLQMVAAFCSEITPKRGEMIFEENSAGDELYLVASGEVDITVNPAFTQAPSTAQSSHPVTIATIRRGQTFGEIALVDQGLRSASARCASRRAHLLVVPRDRLIRLCDCYPELGYRLMRNISADLAFKIRGTDLMIRERIFWQPREK